MNVEKFTQLLEIGHEIEFTFEGNPFFVSSRYCPPFKAGESYSIRHNRRNIVNYISDETLKTDVYVGDFLGIFEHEFKPGITIASHPERFDIICWY